MTFLMLYVVVIASSNKFNNIVIYCYVMSKSHRSLSTKKMDDKFLCSCATIGEFEHEVYWSSLTTFGVPSLLPRNIYQHPSAFVVRSSIWGH